MNCFAAWAHVEIFLKGHSTDFTHEVQFTGVLLRLWKQTENSVASPVVYGNKISNI